MQSNDFCLTALNLKFCYLGFDMIKKLADSLKYNKTVVKLDLSNNALTPRVGNYLLECIKPNAYLSEINFHGNRLSDEFAAELAILLKDN